MPDAMISKYTGDIVAGSLLVAESRKIARLLLDQYDHNSWHQAIVIDNILQKRSPVSAKRQARLIHARLSPMTSDFWEMIETGSSDVATQAVLAAAIKHSRLLGDFMDSVIRQHWKTFTPKISTKDWQDYLKTCAQVNPGIDQWSEATRTKLRQVVFRILSESGYIDGTRTLKLLPVSVIPEIRQYLIAHDETDVLRSMEITQ
ncbi:MAG: DUF1819 family protein [Thermodesulfobacteriota bacterium]